MPTDRAAAVLDAAGLVRALRDRDPVFAEAALSQGDTRQMAEVLAGWRADALRSMDEARQEHVLAGFRASAARDDDGWADYTMRGGG